MTATAGAFYFFIPPMVTFIIILNEIAREKENRLRLGLNIMGMSTHAYWISWVLWGLISSLIVANSTVIFGHMFEYDIFTRAPYGVWVAVFTTFSFSMTLLAFLLGAIVTT